MTKIHINKDKAEVEDDGSLVAGLIGGCKGKLIIKNPLFKGGKREIKQIAKVKEKKER